MEKHSSTLHYSLNYKQRSCLIGHCLSQREISLLMVEVNNSLKPEKKLLYEGQTCRGVIGKGKWFRNGDWKDIMILWSDFSLSPLDHGMAFWSSHKTAKERKFCFVYMLGRHWKFPLRLASGKHTKNLS